MKKLLSGLLLSGLLLAACGNSEDAAGTPDGDLQDGTYTVADQEFGETGWKENLEITIADGKITDAIWTSLDEDGNNKREDDEYQEAMSGVVEIGPQDFIPALEEDLVDTQDPAEVEVVTGATSTSDKFIDYAKQALAAAAEGNEETIEVANSAE